MIEINIVNDAPQKLSLCYYFNWHGFENFNYNFDHNGIPRVDYGSKIGLRYNAITTSQYGLYRLHCFANKNNEQDLGAAISCADWLVENQRDLNGAGIWIYDFDLDFYGPTAPWISGMAQGEGISLLLRTYQMIHRKEYLTAAKSAYSTFQKDVAKGGVCDYLSDGTIFFEEFPTDPPSHVLNGHIFALLGVYDYAQFSSDAGARQLFNDACTGLAKNLHQWDIGFWCLYDLHPTHRLASRMYMRVHVQLLEILSDLSGHTEFQYYAKRWRRYLMNPVFNSLWAFVKAFEKIRILYRNRD